MRSLSKVICKNWGIEDSRPNFAPWKLERFAMFCLSHCDAIGKVKNSNWQVFLRFVMTFFSKRFWFNFHKSKSNWIWILSSGRIESTPQAVLVWGGEGKHDDISRFRHDFRKHQPRGPHLKNGEAIFGQKKQLFYIVEESTNIRSYIHTWMFPKIGVPPNHPF